MPVSSAVICVEGILQKTVSQAPIPLGIALYHSLATNFNLLLISEQPKKELDYWLSIEALNRHAAVEYNDNVRMFLPETIRKFHQVSALRSRKYSIDLIFDPNPSSSAMFLDSGFNVATLIHSAYAMPQWRPDYEHKTKPWSEIEEYQENMAKLKFIDRNITDENKDYN